MKPLKGALFPVAFLLLWEIGMRASGIQSDSLAPPSQIAVAFYEALLDGTVFERTAQTLFVVICGLGIGGGLAQGAETPRDKRESGKYRETEHVKTVYRLARF